ncbi:flagellar biosynthetic protein FliQ [Xylophilus sp. ASV27]|uniref:flagellar biosynthetic protein FliQ n=1 Tax=Xylophilus sp. ASV27 TaxID=2795129 RepID=UPI0018ECC387|nr:flagellar biosynthetic protein FliQ [Xylophilus sp. ASV27]
MSADLALKMMSDLLWTGLMVCMPVLGLTLLVGLVISVVQVVTQVHDASLTFVPKLLTAGICLLMFGPWILRKLGQFATQLWSGIPQMF